MPHVDAEPEEHDRLCERASYDTLSLTDEDGVRRWEPVVDAVEGRIVEMDMFRRATEIGEEGTGGGVAEGRFRNNLDDFRRRRED